MESMRIEKNRPHRIFPTLETGKKEWKEYTVSASVRRLSTKGMAGIAFCLNNSLDTLVFCLDGRDRVLLSYRHKENVTVLKEAEFLQSSDVYYCLEADCHDGLVECSIDGRQLFTVSTELSQRGGKVGITADCPAQFTDVTVTVSKQEYEAI